MIARWVAIAFACMGFVVGLTWTMAVHERQFVLAVIMTLMVLIYAVVELGWLGGSGDEGRKDRWR